MLGLKSFENTRLRTGVRGVSRFGTLLGVVAMVGLAGCDPCMNNPCDNGLTCDGLETCTADGGQAVCTDGTAVACTAPEVCSEPDGACVGPCEGKTCPEGQLCNPANGDCVDCLQNSDCADDLFCNGDETCDSSNACVDGTSPCTAAQTCDEDTDSCGAKTCQSANECDDGDLCTDDTCLNGTCENNTKDCDNGLFCDGADTCDAQTGDCTSAGDPCATDQTCNEDTDACDAMAACMEDIDCADTSFCNGAETCDADGNCVAGNRPCNDANGAGCSDSSATEECSEGDTAAVCTPCPTPTQDFTLGQDDLTGTTGDDVFDGPIEFSPGAGAQIETVQTGDKANGLAGNDTLNGTSNGGAATPTLDGIETLNWSVFDGGFTLAANKITGAQTVNSVDSTQLLTVNNLPNIVGVGLMRTDAGMTLSFDAGATSGSADNLAVHLDPVNGGTITVTPGAANGFESASIDSSGTGKNRLNNLTQTAGTSLVSISFTGAQAMELRRTDATVLTFNGGSMTAPLTLGTGDGSSASPYLAFHATNANIKSITGGSADDMFVFGTTFNGNDASGTTETIDGGGGTGDGMQATLSSAIGSIVPIANMENLFLNATATSSLNLTGVSGITMVTIDGASGGPSTDAITLLNISGTPLPSLDFRGDNTQAAQGYDAITYQSAGTGGSGDSLTVTVGNRGTALNASGTTNVHTLGAITAPFVENLTFTASDGPATVTTGITASTLVSLTVNGSSNVTLNTVTTGGTDSITSINAGGVTGNFSVTSADLATGASLTGGVGNDAFTVGDSGATSTVVTLGAGNDTYTSTDANSADVINAGAGTDTIESDGGSDTISTGSEVDTVVFTRTATADKNTVSDFTAGAGGDVAMFDISALTIAAGDEFVGVIGSVAVNASEEIVILTGVGYNGQAAADTAINGRITTAATDQVYLYFDTGSNTTKIIHFTDSDTGSSTLIGELTNITTQGGHDALTAANIDSRA